MLIFNIHAGVTDNEIVQFMVKNNLLENKLGYDEDEDDIEHIFNHKNDEDDSASISVSNISIKNNINNENEKNEDEKKEEKIKIVFFDEFNTCNSFGLLTEIMCTKKCQIGRLTLENKHYSFIDTPGFDDPRGESENEINKAISENPNIKCII